MVNSIWMLMWLVGCVADEQKLKKKTQTGGNGKEKNKETTKPPLKKDSQLHRKPKNEKKKDVRTHSKVLKQHSKRRAQQQDGKSKKNEGGK